MGFWDDEPQADSGSRSDKPDVIDAEPLGMVTTTAIGPNDAGWLTDLVGLAHTLPPRDLPAIRAEAERIGTALGRVLDDDPDSQGCAAFYRWEAGGNIVEGPTIQLMEALEGSYGRIVSDVDLTKERGSQVNFTVRVVDLMSLVIKKRPFIAHLAPPPAKFAKKHDQAERWNVMQLQSAISKGERSTAERVIPYDIIEVALEAARKSSAAERLGAKTLVEGVAKCLGAFSKLQPAPDPELLERWLGKAIPEWSSYDLQALRGPYRRLNTGETPPDAFVREVEEREAKRAEGEPPANGAPTDRLAGLGLGKDSAGAPSAAPTVKESAAGGDGGGAPSPASSPPTEATAATKSEGEVLREVLGTFPQGRAKEEVAKAAWRKALGLSRVGDERWNAAVTASGATRFEGDLWLEQPPEALEPAERDRLETELADWEGKLDGDVLRPIAEAVGVGFDDGAFAEPNDEQLLRLLELCRKAGGAA